MTCQVVYSYQSHMSLKSQCRKPLEIEQSATKILNNTCQAYSVHKILIFNANNMNLFVFYYAIQIYYILEIKSMHAKPLASTSFPRLNISKMQLYFRNMKYLEDSCHSNTPTRQFFIMHPVFLILFRHWTTSLRSHVRHAHADRAISCPRSFSSERSFM